MNIALFGGSFNPPHNGHLMIAQQMLDFSDSDEVWFLPNYGQAPPKPVASVEDRLAMTKLLVLPRTRVSTIEIDNKLSGETIDILPFLPKEHRFSFVIGSDLLQSFSTWRDWQKLLAAMPFWVYPRHGFPLAPLHAGMRALSGEEINISSTDVRERVARGLSIDQCVPVAVAEYIQKHGLYTSSSPQR